MQLLEGHTDVVPVLAFSPDGLLLASASNDATVRVWHLPSGTEKAVLESSRFSDPSLAFSPDGRWLATPAPTQEIAVWLWDLKDPAGRLELPLSEGGTERYQSVSVVAFVQDGRHLMASGKRGEGGWPRFRTQALLRRWEVGSWKELPSGDFDILNDRAWRQPWVLSPPAGLLATPDYQSVFFWDLRTGKEAVRITGDSRADPGALAFSPDGSRLAVCRARSVLVCDVRRKQTLAEWKNPTTKYIQSLAFSPDGSTLATVSNDEVARLWDAETGREKAAHGWGLSHLKAVAFAPDGMRAAASGKKGDIIVWDVE
jgi:WD40 repeat protein